MNEWMNELYDGVYTYKPHSWEPVAVKWMNDLMMNVLGFNNQHEYT